MDLRSILSDRAQQYILDHQNEDPAAIMLSGKGVVGVSLQDLAQQIKARQVVRDKIPLWFKTPGLVYGPGKAIEQSSSQQTADLKSKLVNGSLIADLTGGMGVDSYFFSKSFQQVDYVEEDQSLCSIAANNFQALGADNIKVLAQTAEHYVSKLSQPVGCIYLDPDRRSGGRRQNSLEDYRPNLIQLLPRLWPWTDTILVKLSPMLDIKAVLMSLGNASAVHVISVKNEVKELLILLSKRLTQPLQYVGVNIASDGTVQTTRFDQGEETSANVVFSEPLNYLYEPNRSLLKLGAFNLVCHRFGVKKLHPNSHLYTSDQCVKEFPGRTFKVQWSAPYKPKEISKRISNGKANVTVRNFPMEVKSIRKKHKIRDGGQDYLFFTTGPQGDLMVIKGIRSLVK